MARRPGLKAIPLSRVRGVLERERRDQWDLYRPVSQIKVSVSDSLAPLPGRYKVEIDNDGKAIRLSENSIRQLASLAGVSMNFLEKVPASLGLKLLRCLIEFATGLDDKFFLLRFKSRRRPVLRAILPQSFVRISDFDVLLTVQSLCDLSRTHVANLVVNDDLFSMRLVLHDEMNLGTVRLPDIARPGIDIRTSETGRYPLEIRHILFRVVCSNGMTAITGAQKMLKKRYTKLNVPMLREVVGESLATSVQFGRDATGRLKEARSAYIKDPLAEVDRVFQKFKLGSPKGKVGRWVAEEVAKQTSMFGVQRFDIVQAFTAVARDLEHSHRLRFEDAMGAYLVQGAKAA